MFIGDRCELKSRIRLVRWSSEMVYHCMGETFFFFKQKTAYEISACLVGSAPEPQAKRQRSSL
eukprot:NODE_29452_length_445_cov_22.531447.p2 GENE.NODE_29452_length_445_cov_22.531447~~NODE_29452_length_445_cov_22.531447.p2  ORF type:complete len:63 (+),score=2.62 NODE_29452_length_445_cov_22.531447:64-252(+)